LRAFNLIDAAVIDEAVRDGGLEDPRQKLKATINKLYGRIVVEDSSNDTDFIDHSVRDTRPPVYLEADETGYPGLDAPVG
jgi:hypothetical protein